MQKSLYTLLFLLTAAAAGAQQMPERSLVRKGNRQYAKGNYEESIRRYEQALEAVPGQFEATYDLGNALYKAERFDRAEQTLRQAAANYAYTKRLIDQDQNGGGGNDQQNQDQNQNQNQDRNQQGQQNPQQGQGRQDPQQGQQDRKDPGQDGNPQQQPPQSDKGEQGDAQGSPQQAPGISPQEQEQILDAIQAQEDKTQEKLKEKRGVVVRGRKNW